MNNNIINIDINKIYPHKDNPRKELGDLTELAESIKLTGILQNLTVIPKNNDDYTVIIGHRRLAAAKLAGLETVPCVVTEMDVKTQLATMLLENIQRSDLTILEQAEGFQMMLDLGDSVNNISKKTGFSESTVRRRIKLMEYDRDKVNESISKGATLDDFVKLETIKDSELKDRALKSMGTNDFNYELKRSLDEQSRKDNFNSYIKQLKTFATEVKSSEGLRFVDSLSNSTEKIKKPADAGEVNYYYIANYSYYYCYLYKELPEYERSQRADEEEQRKIKEVKMKEKKKKLSEITKRAFELRYEFINNLHVTRKNIMDLMEFSIKALLAGIDWGNNFNEELFFDLLDIEFNEENSDESLDFTMIKDFYNAAPEKTLLMAAYCSFGDSKENGYHSWGSYVENKELDEIYDFIQKFGYEMSEDEKALQNGTHEIFSDDE